MVGAFEGTVVGWAVGIDVGTVEGLVVGALVGMLDGATVGLVVGTVVGWWDGANVGAFDGVCEGNIVGDMDGALDGILVGVFDGIAVGLSDGAIVGKTDGEFEGYLVGCALGVLYKTKNKFKKLSYKGVVKTKTNIVIWLGTKKKNKKQKTQHQVGGVCAWLSSENVCATNAHTKHLICETIVCHESLTKDQKLETRTQTTHATL